MDDYAVKLPIAKKIYQGRKKPRLLLKVAKGILLAERIKKVSNNYPDDPDSFEKWVKKVKKLEGKEI